MPWVPNRRTRWGGAVWALWIVAFSLVLGCTSRHKFMWNGPASDQFEQELRDGCGSESDCLGPTDGALDDNVLADITVDFDPFGHNDLQYEDVAQLDVQDTFEITCVSECAGRDCGFDGCGGVCGKCSGENVCGLNGKCGPAPECEGVRCPTMYGYISYCNYAGFCEYENETPTGWRTWDTWILVPAGTFNMGSELGYPAERPEHAVTIQEPYLVAKYEVVTQQYEACLALAPQICTPASVGNWSGVGWGVNTSAKGRGKHPQNGLTRNQANAFCGWVAAGGRIPSEAEWEYAAAGADDRKYPWGDTPEPSCDGKYAVFDPDGSGSRPWGCELCKEWGCSGTKEVGWATMGGSWCGAMDMGGNLWEWTADDFHISYSVGSEDAPSDGSAWLGMGNGSAVMRGGAFNDGAPWRRTTARGEVLESTTNGNIGARCVRPIPECVSMCNGLECGGDGCGGLCGTCSEDRVCEAGLCVCLKHHHTDCNIGELFWYDSCGNLEDLATTCPAGCEAGACL